MNTPLFQFLLAAAAGVLAAGCAGPRMVVATGTHVGLQASPGDGQTTPPAVILGYKRAEMALVPTARERAVSDPDDPESLRDAFSSFAVFDLNTRFFGRTTISQFISTGHAARALQAGESAFPEAFARASYRFSSVADARDQETLQRAIAAKLGPMPPDRQAAAAAVLLGAIHIESDDPARTLQGVLSRPLTVEDRAALSRALDSL